MRPFLVLGPESLGSVLVLGNLGWGLIGDSPDMMIEGYDGQRHTTFVVSGLQ